VSFPDLGSLAASTSEIQAGETATIWSGPLHVSRGVFSTYIYSSDPRAHDANKQRKLLQYDFEGVCRWGGFFGLFARASVLRVSYSLAACLLGTLMLGTGTACIASWHNDEAAMDVDSMKSLQDRVNITVTFILGFFVQLNISRWWDFREFLRQFHGSLADVLLFMASAGASEVQLQQVSRLGMLSQALLFEEIRGVFDDEVAGVAPAAGNLQESSGPYAGLMKMGLLRQDEIAHLAVKQKSQLVWVWIARSVLTLIESGQRLDAAKIQKRCCLGRAAVSAIKCQLGTQLPFTYVQLIAMLVQISHVVMAVGCGYTAAAAWGTGKYALLTSQAVQALLIPLTFQSLLDVCVYVHDPFGSDLLDFSFLQQHVALASLCASLTAPLPASVGSFPDSRGDPPSTSCDRNA